jgi:2-polyprenyl-3-methyl-5-hydroxy-6-metoxy-1,4-benzoquinol methylase
MQTNGDSLRVARGMGARTLNAYRARDTKSSMEYYKERFYAFQSGARGGSDVEAVARGFRRAYKGYHAQFTHFCKLARFDQATPILDVGCGMGPLLYYLVKRGYTNVKGIDLDPRSVEVAQKLGLPAVEADALEFLSACREQYGLVLAFDILEHLSKSEALRLLEAAHRALMPGGSLIAKMPCAEAVVGGRHAFNDITHEWAITAGAMKLVMQMAGFSTVHLIDDAALWPANPFKAVRHMAVSTNRFLFRKLLGLPRLFWSPSMHIVATRS